MPRPRRETPGLSDRRKPGKAQPAPAETVAPDKDRQFVTALARGLDILRCFTPAAPELGTTDIARMTKMPQPTVWRLCHTMVELGFLTLSPNREKLQLGIPVLGLGYAVLAGHPISEVARPHLQALADRHQGAVSMGARDGLSMIYLQRCQGSLVILPHLRVGSRVPLAYSATGWAYIAALDAAGRKALLTQIRKAEGKDWAATERHLDDALQDYSRTGYVVNKGSLHSQVNAVAVPLRSPDNAVLLTLSSGGIASIFDEAKLHDIGRDLKDLAARFASILPTLQQT